jgi:hypothetical protein
MLTILSYITLMTTHFDLHHYKRVNSIFDEGPSADSKTTPIEVSSCAS